MCVCVHKRACGVGGGRVEGRRIEREGGRRAGREREREEQYADGF